MPNSLQTRYLGCRTKIFSHFLACISLTSQDTSNRKRRSATKAA